MIVNRKFFVYHSFIKQHKQHETKRSTQHQTFILTKEKIKHNTKHEYI